MVASVEGDGVLARALGVAAGGAFALPCEGGDDALDLLCAGAREVTAWSAHPGERAVAELALAASRTLPDFNVRSVFGLDAFGRRIFLYHYVRDGRQEGRGPPPPGLSAETTAWLDAHEQLIRTGLRAAGRRMQAIAALRRDLARLGILPRVRAAARGQGVMEGRRLRLALGRRAGVLAPDASTARLLSRWRQLAQGPSHMLQALLEGDLPLPLHLRPDGHARLQDRALLLHLRDAPPPAVGPPLDGLFSRGPDVPAAAARLRAGGRLVLRAWTTPTPGPAFRALEAEQADLRTVDPCPLGGELHLWERR